MLAIYRCECSRTLCALEEKTLLVKRKGLMVVAPLLPENAFIRCDQCYTWHRLNKSRIMEPMTKEDVAQTVGNRCIQCGALLADDKTDCPNCGQPQVLTNPTKKQTRT